MPKKKTPAAPAAATAPANPKQEELGKLTSATLKIATIASYLSNDGRAIAFEAAFWQLSMRGTATAMRFDAAWPKLLARTPPTMQDLQALAALAAVAVAALELAQQSPTKSRCAAALADGATSLDRTEQIFDALS